MPTKSKKSTKKVKVNKLSQSKKELGKGDMKKVKGGRTDGSLDAGVYFKYSPHSQG